MRFSMNVTPVYGDWSLYMVMFFKTQAIRILVRDTKKSDASSCPCDFKVVFDISIGVKTTSEYLTFIYYSIAILYWAVTPRCKRNARHLQWVQKKMVAVQSGFRETSMNFPPLRGIIKSPIFGGIKQCKYMAKFQGFINC